MKHTILLILAIFSTNVLANSDALYEFKNACANPDDARPELNTDYSIKGNLTELKLIRVYDNALCTMFVLDRFVWIYKVDPNGDKVKLEPSFYNGIVYVDTVIKAGEYPEYFLIKSGEHELEVFTHD